MPTKQVFQFTVIALFGMCLSAWAEPLPRQVPPAVPHWADLSADTSAKLRAEGINAGMYERLIQGEVVTERRSVPEGKSGVHLATFGTISGSVDKLWDVVESCGRSSPILPYLKSCTILEPDHFLPPNQRWEQLKIDLRMVFFSFNTLLVNEMTYEAPNYVRWKQVRGIAKLSEGYLRIISIAPSTQIVVYNALVDPGSLIPEFIKEWAVKNTLPDLIAVLRDHV